MSDINEKLELANANIPKVYAAGVYAGGVGDLSNYVQFTDIASDTKAGVVKVAADSGITVEDDGGICIKMATDSEITDRTEPCHPIVPSNLNEAVKAALTDDNAISDMTDEEKAKARDVIGAMGDEYTARVYDSDTGEMVDKTAKLSAQEIYDDGLLDFVETDTGQDICGFKPRAFCVISKRGNGDAKSTITYLDGYTAAEALGERVVLIPEEAPGYSNEVRKAKLKRISDTSVEESGDVKPVYNPEMSIYSAEVVDEKLDGKLDNFIVVDEETGETETFTSKDLIDGIDSMLDSIFDDESGLGSKADKHTYGGGFEGGEGAACSNENNNKFGKGGAIGYKARANDGFSGGKEATAVQTDESGRVTSVVDAIQLGTGNNPNEKTLQVYDYTMMNADGSIPMDRLPSLLGHGIKSISWAEGETATLERGCAYFIKSNNTNKTLTVYDGSGSTRNDAGGDALPSAKWMFIILSDNIRDTQNRTGYNDMMIAPTTLSITDKTFVCFEENADVCVKCDASFYGWKMKM